MTSAVAATIRSSSLLAKIAGVLPSARARRRADLLGCGLGCLGCLPRLILISVAVGAVLLAVLWLVAPWAFYLGGSFHPLPMWQGAARLHSSSGEYVLY